MGFLKGNIIGSNAIYEMTMCTILIQKMDHYIQILADFFYCPKQLHYIFNVIRKTVI